MSGGRRADEMVCPEQQSDWRKQNGDKCGVGLGGDTGEVDRSQE